MISLTIDSGNCSLLPVDANIFNNTMIDKNRDTLDWTSTNPSDASLSHWEYHDFIDQLLDDRLTAEGLLKFKRLHSQLAMNAVVIPAVTFPLAFLANRALVGIASMR